MSGLSGFELKSNMMNGRPTRMKRVSDYFGAVIPPCGEFQETEQSRRTRPPWLKIDTTITRNPLSLHHEIKMFMEYMTPSPEEVATRKDLVKRFTTLIESLDSSVTVSPVGSYVTGLYLPTSDIDMVLKPRKAQTRPLGEYTLRTLYYNIRGSGFASKTDDVLQASVPLIRITDKKTGIEIDLTASDTHSFKATSAVEKWLKQDDTDIARMLIFVVKVFLAVRRCGTTYTGGINSYVLVWMVVAWVKLEWPKLKETLRTNTNAADSDMSVELANALKNLSLLHALQSHHATTSNTASTVTERETTRNTCPDFGEALKAFLKFYGSKFDYENRAISIEPTPRYVLKTYPTVSRLYIVQRFLLSIFDPASPSIDMGEKAYGINHVKASFGHAYRVLTLTESGADVRGSLGAMIGGDFTKFVQKRNNLKVGRSIALQ